MGAVTKKTSHKAFFGKNIFAKIIFEKAVAFFSLKDFGN